MARNEHRTASTLPVTPPTLADVAERSGVSLPYVSEVERGLKEPSSEVLGAVAGALGLRLVDLTARVTRELAASPTRVTGPLATAVALRTLAGLDPAPAEAAPVVAAKVEAAPGAAAAGRSPTCRAPMTPPTGSPVDCRPGGSRPST